MRVDFTLLSTAIVRTLSYFSDGSCLQTDRGQLDGISLSPSGAILAFRSGSLVSHEISVTLEWILRGADRILFLSPDYWPSCWAVHGGVVGSTVWAISQGVCRYWSLVSDKSPLILLFVSLLFVIGPCPPPRVLQTS